MFPREKNNVPVVAHPTPWITSLSKFMVKSRQNNSTRPVAPIKPENIVWGRILSPKNMRAFMALNIVANEKITETKPECINDVA
jgi:hypothetical protein